MTSSTRRRRAHAMSSSTRRRRAGAIICGLSLALLLVPGASLTQAIAQRSTSAPTAVQTTTAAASSAVTVTKTVTRKHLVDGEDVLVESRKVTLKVSETKDLRDRQGIEVSWSGAHPTGGIYADPHSGEASLQEYPMVLLQCRGIDSSSVAAAKRLTPETCWTSTPQERFLATYSPRFPAWRVDRYAAASQRTQAPGEPSPRPTKCYGRAPAEHWLPFVAANGTVYHGGIQGCAGIPPEASELDSTTALPSNTTYGVTGLDGTGFARFDVRDAVNNGSLGCSSTVPCALVAVPIMGVSCDVAAAGLPEADRPSGADAAAAETECTRTGFFRPGQFASNTGGDNHFAVSGALWWSASNWRQRITVPLTMSSLSLVCEGTSSGSVDIYGSELLVQATTQWTPAFCQGGARPVKHVQTGEPQARNLLGTKAIEAAFTSRRQTDGYSLSTVHAPVAVSGFAIVFSIDDAERKRYANLKLTPRLLAKLLTQSYPALSVIKSGYEALKGNPLNISLDPEFIALNPGITKGVTASISASTLYALSSDSDVMHALTAYIDADPEARAWLDGASDPWGMTVNPNYVKIDLPTEAWPMLDTYQPTTLYRPGVNDCLADGPVPYLPLIAAPTSRIASISLAAQYALAPSQTVCYQPYAPSTVGQKLNPIGRQIGGYRFLLGITSLGDAERFGLDTAALLSDVADSAPSQFTDATGRTFVKPTNASLAAAATLITPTASPVDWQPAYETWRSDAKGAKAYPGTMIVYADVPTTGLPSADAKAYGAFLRFAAGQAQVPGFGAGQLPPGFLPMTAANGLGAMADYTSRAADAVAAQQGAVPPLVAPTPTPTPTPTQTVPTPTGTTPTDDSGTDDGTTDGTTPTSSATASAPVASPTPSGTPLAAKPVSAGTTVTSDPGWVGLVLPALLALAALAGLGTGITLLTSREGA